MTHDELAISSRDIIRLKEFIQWLEKKIADEEKSRDRHIQELINARERLAATELLLEHEEECSRDRGR